VSAANPSQIQRHIIGYLDHLLVERGLAKNSMSAYRRDLARYQEFLVSRGIAEFSGVTANEISEFLISLRLGSNHHPALAPSSAARTLIAVRGLHAFLAKEGITTSDSARAVKPPGVSKRLPKALIIINTASSRTQYAGGSSSLLFRTPISGFAPLSYRTFNQGDIESLNYNSSNTYFVVGPGTITTVQDFRKKLTVPGTESYISISPNYKTRNIENRVNLGDPGARGVNRRNYQNGVPQNYRGLDTLNALYLYKSANVNNTDQRTNDLCKFRIAVIDNDDPNLKTFSHFRAFINSFDDSIAATWDPFKYLGRGEDFYTYKGFSRSNNISFTLMAQSVQEMSIMYQKLNYIVSSLAPDYSQGGYMRGNLVQLTLGGYYYEMPGIIENITITLPNDATWEIGIPPSEADSTQFAASPTRFTGRNVQELPHRLDISMTFKPIHNFLPQIVGSSYSKTDNADGINGGQDIKQRFLSLANANPNWKDGNLYGEGVGEVFKIVDPRAPTQIQNLQQTRPSILDPITLPGVQRSSPIASIATPPRR